ncbi:MULTISPECIES: 3-oxoacyl-ACP reductase FabG [Kocuria]|uniref:3-oxoacyl-ACP reductase FabG n=1 Tax=Kocuria subflava TaxID=1736139 RepID=A0A846TK50_9MICC|nr:MULTISPECIES: 3-oxoacyl-ACP reductase FabG [Kocuria]NKE08843.1 3-oxoacyl-ACP reductase FabG [Kocuria subflava]
MAVATPETTEPRVVLVTGGNRGIGKCIADSFRAQGDRVIITYRSGDAPEGVDAVQCDVSSTKSVEAAYKEIESTWGPVEILVANAGITKDTLLMRMSEDDFTSVLDTNLVGAFRVAKRATKGFLKLKRGRVIFISSVVGVTGAPGQANYAASKAGLTGMARAITRELGARNVTANVVAPGYITTDMTAELPEDVTANYMTSIPAARFGDPEEVANAVQWLASPGAGYVNGTVIRVDGGLGMGL